MWPDQNTWLRRWDVADIQGNETMGGAYKTFWVWDQVHAQAP